MIKDLRYHTVIVFLFFVSPALSQDTILLDTNAIDTVYQEPADSNYRSPKKAALLSALLPGAGQIYNHAPEKGKRSIWKVPIIYGGLGTAGYFLYDNIRNYKSFREEYLYRLNNPTADPINYTNYSVDNLRTAIDQYKNWRDLSVVVMAGVYILQIVDASVDAHLFSHDISPELSLNIMPQLGLNTTGYVGLSFTLFRK